MQRPAGGHGAPGLAGDGHDVVLGGAAPAQHHLVLAGEEPIGGSHWGRLVQDTDGAILPDAVGDLIGVHPQCELAGEQLVQLGLAESDLAGYFADDGVHLVVDSDAAVARALGRLLGEPVVSVVFCGNKTSTGELSNYPGMAWGWGVYQAVLRDEGRDGSTEEERRPAEVRQGSIPEPSHTLLPLWQTKLENLKKVPVPLGLGECVCGDDLLWALLRATSEEGVRRLACPGRFPGVPWPLCQVSPTCLPSLLCHLLKSEAICSEKGVKMGSFGGFAYLVSVVLGIEAGASHAQQGQDKCLSHIPGLGGF